MHVQALPETFIESPPPSFHLLLFSNSTSFTTTTITTALSDRENLPSLNLSITADSHTPFKPSLTRLISLHLPTALLQQLALRRYVS